MAREAKVIDVAKDFTPTPGGRYRDEGEFSGEEFRETLLEPALQDDGEVIVDLDGPEGFLVSFLEEVFGGIVRAHGIEIMKRVHVRAVRRPARAEKALEYARDAAAVAKGKKN